MGCKTEVVNAVIELAVHVATRGLGEKTEAQGISIIVGSKDVLLDRKMGKWARLNKYEHGGVSVFGLLHSANKEKLTFLLPDFGLVGALVIDGATGRVLANGWTPTDATEPSMSIAHVGRRASCWNAPRTNALVTRSHMEASACTQRQ